MFSCWCRYYPVFSWCYQLLWCCQLSCSCCFCDFFLHRCFPFPKISNLGELLLQASLILTVHFDFLLIVPILLFALVSFAYISLCNDIFFLSTFLCQSFFFAHNFCTEGAPNSDLSILGPQKFRLLAPLFLYL